LLKIPLPATNEKRQFLFSENKNHRFLFFMVNTLCYHLFFHVLFSPLPVAGTILYKNTFKQQLVERLPARRFMFFP